METKIIRFTTGEEVLAQIIENTESQIKIKHALVPVPSQNGGIGFIPWSPIISQSNPEMTISKNFVLYIVDVDNKVETQYNKMFGGNILVTPEEKKLILQED